MTAEPRPGIAPSTDPLFDTLWGRVVDHWGDDKVHAAFIQYAMNKGSLAEAAARYRNAGTDPTRHDVAQKKMAAIVVAAESLLLASKSRVAKKEPSKYGSVAMAIATLVLAWIFFVMTRG